MYFLILTVFKLLEYSTTFDFLIFYLGFGCIYIYKSKTGVQFFCLLLF